MDASQSGIQLLRGHIHDRLPRVIHVPVDAQVTHHTLFLQFHPFTLPGARVYRDVVPGVNVARCNSVWIAVAVQEIGILVAPADVVCTQLRGRYVKAENDAEGRYHLRLQAQTLQGAAGRQKIISCRHVVHRTCKAMRSLEREVSGDCAEGVQQDVKDSIPVGRGVHRALASADFLSR